MKLDKEFLSEKNYSNPRFVPLTGKKAIDIYNQIQDLQKEANPKIERFQEIEARLLELRKPFEDFKKEVEGEVEELKKFLDGLNARSAKLQEKLFPFVKDQVEGKLDEFEDVVGVEKVNNVAHIKIHDKLEDTIKALRVQKAKITQ